MGCWSNLMLKAFAQMTTAAPTAAPAQNKHLFVQVDTFNTKGESIGTRIVDMYHFGTRNWLQSHHWWAMHNNHVVDAKVASDEAVEAYLVEQKAKLAEKFNTDAHDVAA